jgi:hypothetical protein
MITIEGFSKRQRVLADIIWALESQQQVEMFISTLPRKQKMEARVVCEMMILACIDEVDTVEDEVVTLLNDIAGR